MQESFAAYKEYKYLNSHTINFDVRLMMLTPTNYTIIEYILNVHACLIYIVSNGSVPTGLTSWGIN
jgi:hypothetical protein